MSRDHDDPRWLDETKMLAPLGLAKSTFVGWEKAGVFARDPGGAYSERRALEVVLLANARTLLSLADLGRLWPQLREEGAIDGWIEVALELGREASFDLIIDTTCGDIRLATTDAELAHAVRRGSPRPLQVLDLREAVAAARLTFKRLHSNAERPTGRRVGRPAKRPDNVRHLRSA